MAGRRSAGLKTSGRRRWTSSPPIRLKPKPRLHRRWSDDLLSRHRVAAPDGALARRIIATAPSALWRRTQLVWRCAGLAGIGLAGALAGALTVAVLLPPNSAPDDGDTYALTAFGDVQGDVQ